MRGLAAPGYLRYNSIDMKTKEEILDLLKDTLPYLREKYGIARIGLFGSYARGEQEPDSDIDLLVEFNRPIGFFAFLAAEEYLSEKLGARVELVSNDAVKPLLKPYIMKDLVYVP